MVALFLLLPAFALMLYAMFDPVGDWRPWDRLFGPEENGSWEAVSIDSQPVAPREFRITIGRGAITGGRDGCNDWTFTDEKPNAKGERTIESTLVGCPKTALTRAYYALLAQPSLRLQPDGRLDVRAGGHRAIFRRCRWRTERESGPGYSSSIRVCAPTAD